MWVCDSEIFIDGDDEIYAYCQGGLFPKPLDPNIDQVEHSRIRERFKTLGLFVAKGIEDKRLIDIPFSHPMYKLILDIPLNLEDIGYVYNFLGKSLKPLIERAK